MPGHTLFPSITPTADEEETEEPPDPEALVEQDYQAAVVSIRAGDADAILEDLEELDDRSTVQDAIAKRRDVIAAEAEATQDREQQE